MSFRGLSLPRLEDARFLSGRGQYVDDVDLSNLAWMQVVRSPHAHAGIEKIDATAAREVSGVLGVYTAADLAGLGALPCTVPVASLAPMVVPPRFALADGTRAPCWGSSGVRGGRNAGRRTRCRGGRVGSVSAAAFGG